MNTVDGYAISSWERGYGDMELVPDLATLRPLPWLPGTAMVLCDLAWLDDDHSPVVESPRGVLTHQVEKAAEMGFVALAGTELEFMVFDDTFEHAWDNAYRGLTPSTRYNVDYSVLGTTKVEPLLRAIRNGMFGAGFVVESAKGECNLGQQEIAFLYDEVLRTADQHSVYKNGSKEIAALQGKSITYMAKFDEREGNSCHIHMSLRGTDGGIVFDEGSGMTPLFASFVAGIQASMCELTLLYAPNVNSYKRFQAGSFAPTSTAWGYDNRTCSLRVVGHGAGMRLENRLPGGDVNPYLAMAGMLAERAARHRAGARARAGLRRQRLQLAAPARPADPAGGARPLPRLAARPRDARRRRRRPLHQLRRRRARRVQRDGDRLGALPRLREDVTAPR